MSYHTVPQQRKPNPLPADIRSLARIAISLDFEIELKQQQDEDIANNGAGA